MRVRGETAPRALLEFAISWRSKSFYGERPLTNSRLSLSMIRPSSQRHTCVLVFKPQRKTLKNQLLDTTDDQPSRQGAGEYSLALADASLPARTRMKGRSASAR